MSEPDAGTAAIVLAAGASTRLGQAKQLIEIEGESLLRRTARLALEAGCAPVFVVLGFEAERLRAELAGLGATAVIHEHWAEGMGSSLRRGMEMLRAAEARAAGVLLLVCDQPGLAVEHLQRLLAEQGADENRIAASEYAGRTGVPAVFGRGFFAELLAIEGDRGAREVMRQHTQAVSAIPWPEGAMDLDRPEDLERLRKT